MSPLVKPLPLPLLKQPLTKCPSAATRPAPNSRSTPKGLTTTVRLVWWLDRAHTDLYTNKTMLTSIFQAGEGTTWQLFLCCRAPSAETNWSWIDLIEYCFFGCYLIGYELLDSQASLAGLVDIYIDTFTVLDENHVANKTTVEAQTNC